MILAVDPGLEHPAAALLHDDQLLRAERVRIPKEWAKLGILDRCERIAEAIFEWYYPLSSFRFLDRLTFEWPQWYAKGKTINPNDLAGLCGIAGALAGRVRACQGSPCQVLSPCPREVWGNVPKAITGDPWKSPRGRRLASRLSTAEREVVLPQHDALDAAGLALWTVGRWKQVRVYPGAV